LLEYIGNNKILTVDLVWKDARKKYEKRRNSKYKRILQDKSKGEYYKKIESKYEVIYKRRNDRSLDKSNKEVERKIYNLERKYLVSNLIEKNKRCLICGNQLYNNNIECDHILCKDKFPVLGFIPINLAIICHNCNKSKGNKIDIGIFNPYFDNYNKEKLKIMSELYFLKN